ncbi:hypothetical protein [Pseudolactococcus laudensis]|uniref:hypothetical protein n=1 Tax=Pseudolactococcus laudensis TaxID=1494461 RepID=UPI002FC97477
MNTVLKKVANGVLITVAGGLFLSSSVNAATLEDAKKSVLNGNGEMIHPGMHRRSTDEETKANKNVPYEVFRKMTKEEADEYFSYIDKYQAENNTDVVPESAYDYIQYITEKLDASKTTVITDELRAEAEKYVNESKQNDSNKEVVKVKKEKKTTHKKTSLWAKIISFKWF